MTLCYIALGSNIGDSESIFNKAIALIKESKGIFFKQTSSFYLTTPVDCPSSPRLFLNAVLSLESELSLHELFALLKNIEYSLGKTPKAKNESRIIDIDLLFYGSITYFDENIIIPHPRWHRRLFVVKPLSDLTDTIHLSVPINIKKMVSLLSQKTEEKVYESCKN